MAFEDVTERNRIHEELVRSNEDLQRFACIAAHDLRSPLNSARNLSRLLARCTEEKLDEQDREMLRTSLASLDRLSALTNDILTYSETGNAPQQLRLISLDDPLQVALANLKHHIEDNGASITVGLLPEVRSGRTQMVMVFQSLIGNALKYRRPEAPHLRIEAVREGGGWRISVADNGQGFEAVYDSAIFEPFKRLRDKAMNRRPDLDVSMEYRELRRCYDPAFREWIPQTRRRKQCPAVQDGDGEVENLEEAVRDHRGRIVDFLLRGPEMVQPIEPRMRRKRFPGSMRVARPERQ